MGSLADDLRVAVRRFYHQPGFTTVVLLTLALGLGANTAIFTLVDGLMLRSLPVANPESLYRLGDTNDCCVNSGLPSRGFSLFSYRLVDQLRTQLPEFAEIAGFQATTMTIGVRRDGASVPEFVPGQFVTANYFQMFGVTPAAGRLLTPGDDRPGAPPVVVLSYRGWERFGRNPQLVGGTVTVNGLAMTVAGVAAPEFFGETIRPDPPSIWIPLGQERAMRGEFALADREMQHWLYAMGRLRPDVRPERASARATVVLQQWLSAQNIPAQYRDRVGEQRITVTPAGSGVPTMHGQYAQSILLLFATSAVLLLIGAANLANLLLARADRGQVAIRAALGASSRRLVRQSLTEGVLLAIVGGLLGIGVANLGTRALLALAFPGTAYLPVSATPSPMVLLFAFVLAVVTGMLFTGAPAWAMARTAPLDALSGVGRNASGRSFVPRRSLVITQVALSFVMLSGAGLLARSLSNLEGQALGFDPENRLVLRLENTGSADPTQLALRYAALQERLRREPGIVNVTYALYSPMEGNNWSSGISIAGRRVDPANRDSSSWNRVGPQYFSTIGTPVVRGRALDERDAPGARRVAVVSRAFATQFFEGVDPIGRTLGLYDAPHAADFEIVGVVEDVKYVAANQPVRPMIFFPAFQIADYPESEASSRNVQLRSISSLRAMVVQTAPGMGAMDAALRRAIGEVDPHFNLTRVVAMPEQVGGNFRIERLLARLTTIYGALALILTSLGLYGVTTYSVSRRTREIGVRMALGAPRPRIMRTIVGGPVVETLVGLALGLPLALMAGRAIASLLYGIDGQNLLVLTAVVVTLIGVAALAAAIPARRAASIDPARALRGE
jgi:predicted permease